ncbi:MAG: chorismate mutase [Pseudobdellovibrionaceae bacterium]
MYKSPILDEIRKKIDSLDNNIHDLLMERADLIMAISEEKKRQGIQIVQPGREARMIRRLMARHRGPLPQETIAHIWRELVSSVSLLQTGLSVAVYFTAQDPEYWDMARDYFGSVLPMTRVSSAEEALRLAREGQVTFSVVPFPRSAGESQWVKLLHDGNTSEANSISVIQRLPFGFRNQEERSGKQAAIISLSSFGPSDDDHSLLLMECKTPKGTEQAKTIISAQGLKVADVMPLDGGDILLADIEGFFENGALILTKLAQEWGSDVTLIGGYPTPIIYARY